MSANNVTIYTLILPEPAPNKVNRFLQLNSSVSFEYTIPNLAGNDIVALSTTNAVPGNDINGLLYLPELDTRGTCHDKLYDLVPRNTTTQSNLPNGDAFWTWVAVAPWISPECFLEFLHAAEDDDLRAFIFYLPDNSTTVPDPKDPRWLTSDGKWRSWARFPVYAISGYNGAILTDALSRYSGNLTDVPYGHMLANEFPLQSYVRLAASLTIDGKNTLPSLWVFLLLVLGILLVIIGSTSIGFHWLQRRRRTRLRNRVVRGEVDLEKLGIKKLTVPPALLDNMPLYTYPEPPNEKDHNITSPTSPQVTTISKKDPNLISKIQPNSSAALLQKTPPPTAPFSQAQPTCAICLEDFLPSQSEIRSLPCYHIFHAQCVDPFLLQTSSLCPLCKKTSLPLGYCPPVITNAMVRRERMVRGLRDRVPRASRRDGRWASPDWTGRAREVLSPRSFTSPRRTESLRAQEEGIMVISPAGTPAVLSPSATPRPFTTSPQRQNTPGTIEENERPKWKRAVGKIWPT